MYSRKDMNTINFKITTMTFKRIKEISSTLLQNPIFNDLSEEELSEYYALLKEPKYRDWELKNRIKQSGMKPGKHCCVEMEYHLLESIREKEVLKEDPEYINYDAVITWDKSRRSYGIPIHDGGSSYIRIRYCPWCGKNIDHDVH